MARRIVGTIRHGNPMGRFLKRDEDGLWREVGDKVAAEKTSQGTKEMFHDFCVVVNTIFDESSVRYRALTMCSDITDLLISEFPQVFVKGVTQRNDVDRLNANRRKRKEVLFQRR